VYYSRLIFQRALAFIYFIGFCIAINQYLGLLGSHGILPVQDFLKAVSFWDAPSLLWLGASDGAIRAVSWSGLLLAVFAMSGWSERLGHVVSAATWILLWVLYQSLVNPGQVFYGFGWEMLLLETGFLAIFMGCATSRPPAVVLWLVVWAAFRIMFGAGLIKLRGDECWRDLTCMVYHYETQPSPNPLSWYFHHTPLWFHKAEVGFNHFIELVVPFFLFAPRLLRYWAAGLTILFQFILILSGNLSWLNYITIVLCLPCFDDRLLAWLFRRPPPKTAPMGEPRRVLLALLVIVIAILSVQPVTNLFSPRQAMNASFDPLHLVNTYGAFGSITRERNEIILEGTDADTLDGAAIWREYEFKAKPGDVARMPSIASPYHYKLDWQMWFAAMGPPQYQPWIVPFVHRLLQNEPAVTDLLAKNPFPAAPPRYLRARLYRYRFTDSGGLWWKRELLGEYLPPIKLTDFVERK
jgi:hypothetical protein